jgi:hypothetical protein
MTEDTKTSPHIVHFRCPPKLLAAMTKRRPAIHLNQRHRTRSYRAGDACQRSVGCVAASDKVIDDDHIEADFEFLSGLCSSYQQRQKIWDERDNPERDKSFALVAA